MSSELDFVSEVTEGKLHPISLHTSVIHKENVYIFGGVDEHIIPQNKFVSIDMSTFKTEEILPKEKLPLERCGHISTFYENNLYIHGGKQHGELFEDIWCFDFQEKEWKEVSLVEQSIGARCFHSGNKKNSLTDTRCSL
jgi:N-acetylneuraminic acid mutarotase